MLAKLYSCTTIGISSFLISIEAISVNGLPQCTLVGLPSQEVKEAKERVYGALKASGFKYPQTKKIINLAPSDIPKRGTHFDLPLALAILLTGEEVPKTSILSSEDFLEKTVLLGELSLNGDLKPVKGVLSAAKMCKEKGFTYIIVPHENVDEARLISGLTVLSGKNLREIVQAERFDELQLSEVNEMPDEEDEDPRLFDEIKGNEDAKMALVTAIAGGHNICFFGPPGSGKSMLAKSSIELLPELSDEEKLEVMQIYSVTGEKLRKGERPFRTVHHTASKVGIIGGSEGVRAGPGEITLAHKGVLFLDEITEFNRDVLEALRQPLEDKVIHITRASYKCEYPADFLLIATFNPCPCGFLYETNKRCMCSVGDIAKYEKKLSGPMRDRIDIFVHVPYRKNGSFDLLSAQKVESVESWKNKIADARALQTKRFGTPTRLNTHMTLEDVRQHCLLTEEAKALFEESMTRFNFSPRVTIKLLKIARTIADLSGSEKISKEHIQIVLKFREKEK